MSILNLSIDPTLADCVICGTRDGLSMTGLEPEAVGVSRFTQASRELSVIVGLHGRKNGNMTLNLSERTAKFIAGRLIGVEISELDEDAVDAVCEVGNIVAGRYKELLQATQWQFEAISLPAMVFGANYSLYHLKNIVTVAVTFEIKEVSVVHMQDKFFTSSISLLGTSGTNSTSR
jgi:CheY-specific phosphatase CheX